MTIKTKDPVGVTDGQKRSAERAFDPWRTPIPPAGQAFLENVIEILTAHEEMAQLRKRKRRPDDQRTFERMVTALVSDLAINTLCDEARGIHLSRSNRQLGRISRYGNAATSKTLRQLLDQMADPDLALIEQRVGFRSKKRKSKRTVVVPSDRLRLLVHEHGLTVEDYGERLRPELIELKSHPVSRTKRGELIDYRETTLTTRMRSQMREINTYLRIAEIEYIGPNAVDINKRQLRRVFTRQKFESGGRLFGGFWQLMGKRDRLFHININGEDAVELDYGQVMPRLVYALAGVNPTMDDLYAIEGFERCRPGVKRVASSMLFVDAPLSRFPQETRHLFPQSIKVSDVTDAIISSHPDIAAYFFTGIGHRCQFLESEILIEVLLTLMSMNIVALPIHDAIIVPASSAAQAKAVMLEVFKKRTGQEGAVELITKE
ncbi:hypothetical protein, partial [Thalassovita mediterranea]|uniref:hypothetical protein n=2 Tax=Thalassovita mediterranea TaxID=340021 RepID=UPI00071E1139